MGMTAGVWLARVPAAKAQAHLSDGTLGVALFAVPVGLVLGAALAERLVDRVGSRVFVRVCGVAACVAVAGPGLARNLPELMAALFVIGVVGGSFDVSTNAQGVRVEAAYGRPVMTSMHACYSLGAILGSLAGGGFAWAGVTLLPSLAAVGAVGAVINGTAGRWLLPEPGTPETPRTPEAPQTPGTRLPAEQPKGFATTSSTALATSAPRDAKHVRRLVLALGVLGVCALVCEGAAGDWSAVYLRDNLGTSAGFAAVGFAAFSAAMTVGRGAGDRLIRRFGVVRVIRACGVLATAGVAAALITPSPGVTVVGFTAFGAGLSIVVPQVFAAGGRADPARPGSGLAKVVGFGYTGMAAGPAVIGLVAGRIGLRLALAILVVLASWIAVGARALTPRGASPEDAGASPGEQAEHGTVRDEDRWPRSRAGQLAEYRYPMDDREILTRISSLIETEHDLRSQLADGRLSSEQERERLRSAEEALDQCWDLLRQRRAKREFGENPESAAVRPATEVEGYQQLSGSGAGKRAKEHRAYREVRQGRRGRLRRR
jgi:MFS family permease